MEPLFYIRMVLDEDVLREYAEQNVRTYSDGYQRMRLKIAGFLIALAFIGFVTRDPGRLLLTAGIVAAAFAALERKRRSQKGKRKKIAEQVDWMRKHLAPGELGSATTYLFFEHEMVWENDRCKGTLDYANLERVQETDRGFFVAAQKDRRLVFWKTSFIAGNPREFRNFMEQKIVSFAQEENRIERIGE